MRIGEPLKYTEGPYLHFEICTGSHACVIGVYDGDGARFGRTAYQEKSLTNYKVVHRGPNDPTSTMWRAHSENRFHKLEEKVSLHGNLVTFHLR